MRYEPTGYIVEYEIGALIVFLVIMARFLRARRFPNQRNRLFGLILWGAVANIVLDVVSSLIIDDILRVPPLAVYVVNTAFYMSSILMLILMMAYTMALTEHLDAERVRRALPLLLPGMIVAFLLLCNPLNGWYFYIDPVRGYMHGPLFFSVYLCCAVYLAFTFTIAVYNRASLRRQEFMTILEFLSVVLAATVLQYFIPALLATGVAITFSVVLMYFTIQNPDSMRDSATETFTSAAMLTFLQDQIQEKKNAWVVAIKINNMPRINEILGIENGNALLRQISRYMLRGSEDLWVFRMRGSCFAAVVRTDEEYRAVAAKLQERAKQPWMVNGTEVFLQATICCMATRELSSSAISPEEAVNFLETTLALNERSGSQIVTVTAGAELYKRFRRSREVEAALREAIETETGLELYFQPVWSFREQRFVSAEALLRFRHPAMGFISPEEFVPMAESKGLVTRMDELVVRMACAFIRDNARFRELGIRSLDVNLSALEFMRRRLPELLGDIMTHYGVSPSFLCFEITETAATESFELLKDGMEQISRCGCKFALDDFGTGYANVSQVIQLPFSTVKLDRSLLYGPKVVIEDMAHMFTRLGRSTVVEGVESEEQAELVKACGVDLVQGFYYAWPMNKTEFIKFLEQSNGAIEAQTSEQTQRPRDLRNTAEE